MLNQNQEINQNLNELPAIYDQEYGRTPETIAFQNMFRALPERRQQDITTGMVHIIQTAEQNNLTVEQRNTEIKKYRKLLVSLYELTLKISSFKN